MQARQETEVFDRIEAREVVIKNKSGVEVVSLSSSWFFDYGEITIYNREGVRSSEMKGGSIFTLNKHGHNLVVICKTTDDHGGIWIYDRYGEHPAFYGHRR